MSIVSSVNLMSLMKWTILLMSLIAYESASGGLVGDKSSLRHTVRDLEGANDKITYTLRIVLKGNGFVRSMSDGQQTGAIVCGTRCSAGYYSRKVVTLVATPAAGFAFAGWSGGGCIGSTPCSLAIVKSKAITANFVSLPSAPAVTVPPLPPETPFPENAPKTADGDAILAYGPSGTALTRMRNPPADPTTALGKCAALVTFCYRKGVGSVDSCMASAPKCATNEPWNEESACCAAACQDKYAQARKGGADEATALTDSLFEAPSCMPQADTQYDAAAILPMLKARRVELVNMHNGLRALHCAQPLQWSRKLAHGAQAYAEQQAAAGCQLVHSPDALASKVGENLAILPSARDDIGVAVAAWYGEAASYDFSNPGFSSTTGHFSQLVWKSSRLLGCGAAACGDGRQFVVCNYNSPGNITNVPGAFGENVQAEPVPPASCPQ